MSDEERESDLGEWCSEHREFYTEGTPCPGCKVIREAKIEGAKEALNEVYEMIVDRHISGGRAVTLLEEAMRRGEWPKETP